MPPTSYSPPVAPVSRHRIDRRNAITLKLLFIATLVLVLQAPLFFVNRLRTERLEFRAKAAGEMSDTALEGSLREIPKSAKFAVFRMVERSLKHSVLVLALVFTAFFLFETVLGLRLHLVHYALVGAALCLFYLALLSLGEVLSSGLAYGMAAVASSGLIVLYSAAVLKTWIRAGLIAGLLGVVHGVLYAIMLADDYALLAGTGALFVGLAAVMYFTRNIDWSTQEPVPATGGAK